MNKIKGEILNYRIVLKVSFIWVFGSPFRVAASHCSAKWAQIGKCPFLSGEFVWRAEFHLCRAANCPNVPPWVCNVLCPSRLVSLWQFTLSDLVMDWEKSRSCCFPVGNCPNSVCFIKKIAGISLMAKTKQHDSDCAVLGLPWLHSPVWQRNHTQENKWKVVLGHPPSTGTTAESWWDPELALTELEPFGPGCRGITANGEKLAVRDCLAILYLWQCISPSGEPGSSALCTDSFSF